MPYEEKYLIFVKQATTNLDELTNDLLDYAKSDTDSIEDEKLNLNHILQTVTFNLTETIKTVKGEIVLPADSYIVQGKKLQLIQLFQNLISNSSVKN